MSCPACRSVWPPADHKITDLRVSTAYLFEDQFFRGRTVLVLTRHATELYVLSQEARATLIEDVTTVAEALQRAFTPVKINYELLGNQLPHMHWHIIPRLADDPAPREPIWTVQHESKRLESGERERCMALIRKQLHGVTI